MDKYIKYLKGHVASTSKHIFLYKGSKGTTAEIAQAS